jgi:hypothetical protein
MMSSVIPARLQFQCGHAALVTLPRVKGESSVQRNERIAREKSAALARQCDFCGPTVAIAAATRPDEVSGVHMTAADVVAAEPVVAADSVVAAEEPFIVEPVGVVEEPVVVVAEEPVVTVEEPVVVVEEPIVLVEEPIVLVVEEPVAVEPLVVLVEEEPVQHHNGATMRPAVPTKRQRKVAAVSRGRRFLAEYQVEYQAERVVRAADIRDALRKAAALGASEVLAITRED